MIQALAMEAFLAQTGTIFNVRVMTNAAFHPRPGYKPIPFGFLLLVLLTAELVLALAITIGKLPREAVLGCLLAGILFPAIMIAVVTVLLWTRPPCSVFERQANSARRAEVIIDVAPSLLENIWQDFLSEGADVAATRQPDGRYTVEALFTSA